MTPEGKIKAMVNRALSRLVFPGVAPAPACYRFCPVQNGMGSPALDYYCCINGRFVAIETKARYVPMTARQKETARIICATGGLFFLVYDDDSLSKAIATICNICQVECGP